jgi:uncharacterized protein affecting Mg2+/Co2+ transport
MLLQSFPAAPALPLPTSRDYPNELNNVLRLYFNQLSQRLQAVTGGNGGQYLQNIYGAFSSYTTQSTTANTATLMTLSQTDFANGVYLSSNKIYAPTTGIYNFQFSAQIENTSNASQDLFIWLRQGNDGGSSSDITGSTGIVGLPPRKSPGDPFHTITGWNYFVSMAKDDYIQIYWSVTDAAVTIPTYAASGSPTKPSTASVVATLSFVSAVK